MLDVGSSFPNTILLQDLFRNGTTLLDKLAHDVVTP